MDLLEGNLRCTRHVQDRKNRNAQTTENQSTDNPKPKPVTWKNILTRYPSFKM